MIGTKFFLRPVMISDSKGFVIPRRHLNLDMNTRYCVIVIPEDEAHIGGREE
jgi:hypothetical protein